MATRRDGDGPRKTQPSHPARAAGKDSKAPAKRRATDPIGGSGLLPVQSLQSGGISSPTNGPDESTTTITAVSASDESTTMLPVIVGPDESTTAIPALASDESTTAIPAMVAEDSPAPIGPRTSGGKRRPTEPMGSSHIIPIAEAGLTGAASPVADPAPAEAHPRRTTAPIGGGKPAAQAAEDVTQTVAAVSEPETPRRTTARIGGGPKATAPSDEEALTQTLEAMADAASAEAGDVRSADPLGSGPLESGRSEPSKPNAVIGPITRRHRKTAPYLTTQSGELLLEPEGAKTGQRKARPKPQRTMSGRILRGAGWTLAALVVLVLLVVGFFHTGPGKDVARGIVESALQKRFDGEVTLGAIDYAIFGTIELKDLKIKEKGGARTVVHLSHLLVDPDWGTLLSKPIRLEKLAIDGLALDLVAFPDGTNNLNRMQREPSQLPGAILIDELSLANISLSLERGEGADKTLIDLAELGLTGHVALDDATGTASVEIPKLGGRLTVSRGEAMALSLPLGATLSAKVERGEVLVRLVPELSAVKVTRDGQDLAIPLSVGPLEVSVKDKIARVGLGAIVAGPLKTERLTLEAALPSSADAPLSGSVLLELAGLQLEHTGANALIGTELLKSDVGMSASLTGPQNALELRGAVTTDGGTLTLTGKVDASKLLAPIYEFTLLGDGIDTSRLLASVTSRQSLRSSFKLAVSGVGLPNAGGHAKLDLTVDKTIITETTPEGAIVRTLDGMKLEASTDGPIIALDGLVVRAFGQSLTVGGQIDRETREVRATMRMSSRLAEAIANAREAGVLITPLPPIEGEIDVDFLLSGRLKPFEDLARLREIPADAPLDFQGIPFETLSIKGFARGHDIVVLDRKVGSLHSDVDIELDERGPAGMKGRVATRVGGVEAGTLHLDGLDLEVLLDGFVQQITLSLRDQRQKLTADLALTSRLDLERRHVDATFERVEVQRGTFSTRLLEPVTVGIDQSIGQSLGEAAGGTQRLVIPPVKLSLAGGTVSLASTVDLAPDPKNPGANALERFDTTVDLEGVDIQALAALARRSTQGLTGRLSGTLHAQGTPANPQVELFGTLRSRLRGGEPTTSKIDLTLRNQTLDARVSVLDAKNKPILELDALAPLTLPSPDQPNARPALAPGGRLSLEAKLFPTTVGRLAAVVSLPALAELDPDAKLSGQLAMSGTASRPSGSWSLSFEGDVLRRRGFAKAPARQKLELSGTLARAPSSNATALDNRVSLWLDAGAPALLTHTTRGEFARSPLLRDFLSAPWTLSAGLDQPLDLRDISKAGLTPDPVSGQLSSRAELAGKAQDVLGTLTFALSELRVADAPRVDLSATTTIADDHIGLRQTVKVAGLDALALDARAEVPGRGLRAAPRQPRRLMAAPISGELRLVEHRLSAWRSALGEFGRRLPELPGHLGGALTLGGTLATPTAEGAFAWSGFSTLSGEDGRVALAIIATPTHLSGGLEAGPTRDVRVNASLERAALAKLAPTAPLPVELSMRAAGVDLARLVPAFALAPPSSNHSTAKPLDFRGKLDWDMKGALLLERDPERKLTRPLAPGSSLLGHLTFAELDVAIPDTDRHLRDGKLALVATRDALKLEGLHFREADIQRADRTVDLAGEILWADLVPSEVRLTAKTREWLVMGLSFDRPEGELDLELDLAVTRLDQPIKRVDLSVKHLELNAPDRFPRAHFSQFPAYEDLLYVGPELASGKLPVKRRPPMAALFPSPDQGLDIRLDIPAPIHLIAAAASPIELKLQGRMDISVRGLSPDVPMGERPPRSVETPMGPSAVSLGPAPASAEASGATSRAPTASAAALRGPSPPFPPDAPPPATLAPGVTLSGRLDVTEGWLGAMGRDFTLVTGAITADGPVESALAELVFAHRPHDIALRDVGLGAHDQLATITVRASAKTGLQTIFGGVSGPYLLDMATFLNTGRGRLWGPPDSPASETVRFGTPDQGLINSFVQTNLRNLVFMDRANAWAPMQDDHAQYGRLRHFDMQRFLPAEDRSRAPGQRLQFTAQPLAPGQGPFSLSYDWLLVSDPRTVLGFGPFLDFDLRAGLGLSLEWSSD